MIETPKVAHFYWGSENLPLMRYLTLKTFSYYNPQWKMILHVPEVKDTPITWLSYENKTGNSGENYYNRISTIPALTVSVVGEAAYGPRFTNMSDVHRADLIRYGLIHNSGGIWSDMDILYIKPIPMSSDTHESYIVGYTEGRGTDHEFPVGFLASKPGSSLFGAIKNEVERSYNPNAYEAMGCVLLYRHLVHNASSVGILPASTVYPLEVSQISSIFNPGGNVDIAKESFGVHWYAGHPIAGEFVKRMNFASDFVNDDAWISRVLRESSFYQDAMLNGQY